MGKRTGRDITCQRCGKVVYRPLCALRRGGKFCSLDCTRIAHRGSLDHAEAFWLKVDKNAPSGCWLYTGFIKWDGYGWLARKVNGKPTWYTAHRYAWILTNGEPPDGLHVLHKCDVPSCCNPKHLWLGTHQDNMDDRTAKGRNLGNKVKLWPDRIRPVKEAA